MPADFDNELVGVLREFAVEIDGHSPDDVALAVAKILADAIWAERERCAKMVDVLREQWFHDGVPGDTAVPAGAFARSMKDLAAVMRSDAETANSTTTV